MKQNVFKILAVALLIVGFCVSANAKPYKYSLGVVAGMQIGPSAKFLLGKNHHFMLIQDLSYSYNHTAGSGLKFNTKNLMGGGGGWGDWGDDDDWAPQRRANADYYEGWTAEDYAAAGMGGATSGSQTVVWEDFASHTNLGYQGKGVSGQGIDLDWYAGGGMSLGALIATGTGGGGKFGINAIGGIEINMSNAPIAVDFDFRPGYAIIFYSFNGEIGLQHAFDWQLAFSIRYTF